MSIEDIFNRVYKDSVWGYKSGSGSDPKNAEPWIALVNQYLGRDDVSTVLDLGCGDGRLMERYDLAGIQYLGVDVSSDIISEKVERSNIKFVVGDAMTMEIPETDLIIIKDVLQHLPIEYIQHIVPKLIVKAKIVIFCNDVETVNRNISVGGYRGIDLLAPPFNFNLRPLFDFISDTDLKRIHIYEKGHNV